MYVPILRSKFVRGLIQHRASRSFDFGRVEAVASYADKSKSKKEEASWMCMLQVGTMAKVSQHDIWNVSRLFDRRSWVGSLRYTIRS